MFLKIECSHYVGQKFPEPIVDSSADFAILRIFDEGPNEEYRAGFCGIDADIVQIEEAVRACTTKL
jgi:hypothetical protein